MGCSIEVETSLDHSFDCLITRSAVNIKPAIHHGQLSYTRGRHWRDSRVGHWTQGVGVSGAKHLGEVEVQR